MNDHGLVLAPAQAIDLDAAQWRALFATGQLLDDLRAAVNLGERRVATASCPVACPGTARQLQASAGLLYDVLREHDPDHLLLALAEQEVLNDSLDMPGLQQVLARIRMQTLGAAPGVTDAVGFPLWAERLRGQFSNEDWRTRVQRVAQQLERRYGR